MKKSPFASNLLYSTEVIFLRSSFELFMLEAGDWGSFDVEME